MVVVVVGFLRGSEADDSYRFPKGSTQRISATVGHSLRSALTDGRRFAALGHSWWSPIQELTEVDVA
jgi:hypothetical protein